MTAKKANGARAPETKTENLEQVRELLFGGTARAMSKRLDEVDTKLRQSWQAAQLQLSERIDALDDSAKKERQRLAERQTELREAEGKRLDAQHASAVNELRQTLREFDERIEQQDNALKALISDEISQLRSAQTQQLNDLQSQLNSIAARLEDGKVDRGTLAGLLRGLSVCLDGDQDALSGLLAVVGEDGKLQ